MHESKKTVLFLGTGSYGAEGLAELLTGAMCDRIVVSVGTVGSASTSQDEVVLYADAASLDSFDVGRGMDEFINWTSTQLWDLVVVMGFPHKLPKNAIRAFSALTVNFHPSQLPRWRGAIPLECSILAEDALTITCHRVSEDLDAGEIVATSEPIQMHRLSVDCLMGVAANRAALLLRDVIRDFLDGDLSFRPQEGLDEHPVIYRKERDTRIGIDFSRDDIADILRKLTATYSYHGQIIRVYEGESRVSYRVSHGRILKKSHDLTPGTVVDSRKGRLVVAARGGIVIFLQSPGGTPITLESV